MKRRRSKSSLILAAVFFLIFVTCMCIICPLKANKKPKQEYWGPWLVTQLEKENRYGNSVWLCEANQFIYIRDSRGGYREMKNPDESVMKLSDYLAMKQEVSTDDD